MSAFAALRQSAACLNAAPVACDLGSPISSHSTWHWSRHKTFSQLFEDPCESEPEPDPLSNFLHLALERRSAELQRASIAPLVKGLVAKIFGVGAFWVQNGCLSFDVVSLFCPCSSFLFGRNSRQVLTDQTSSSRSYKGKSKTSV